MVEENRKARRAAKTVQPLTQERFLQVADQFIDLANRKNKTVLATDLHMVFLYASTRYAAHVGKNVLEIEEHEPFVEEMTKTFQEMLRTHLSDPEL